MRILWCGSHSNANFNVHINLISILVLEVSCELVTTCILRCKYNTYTFMSITFRKLSCNIHVHSVIILNFIVWDGSIDSMERGTVEWNSGMVERWNTGMVERAINDPVPF